MGEHGVVIDIKDDKVKVRLERTEACAKCRVCTVGMSGQEMFVEASNGCDAQLGDTVNLELKSESFVKAVSIMYLAPLCALVLGLGLGWYIPLLLGYEMYSDIISFLVGMGFTALTYICIRKNEHRFAKNKSFVPVASEIITNTKL